MISTQLIENYQLKKHGSEEGDFRTRVQIYNGPGLRLMHSREAEKEWIELAPETQSEEWFDVALVKAFLENVPPTPDYTPVPILETFLIEKKQEIKEVFDVHHFAEVRQKLLELRKQRARLMFPGIYKE